MTETNRPDPDELAWPSEDLPPASQPKPRPADVEWPSEDVVHAGRVVDATTPSPPEPPIEATSPRPPMPPSAAPPVPGTPPEAPPPTFDAPPAPVASDPPPDPWDAAAVDPAAYQSPAAPGPAVDQPAVQPAQPVAGAPDAAAFPGLTAPVDNGRAPGDDPRLAHLDPSVASTPPPAPRVIQDPYASGQAAPQPPLGVWPPAAATPPAAPAPITPVEPAQPPAPGPYAPPPQAPDPYAEDRPPPTPAQGNFGQFRGPAPIESQQELGPYATTAWAQPSDREGDEEASEDEQKRQYFRPDIEGLRAVAVLAVLFFHVGVPFFGGGFVGVDVFFVISGFLITGLLLREGETTGKVDLLAFYARRMRRLLPAALLVIVVTLALSVVIVSPLRLTEIAGDAAASALYVANFRFAIEATNYLAVQAPSPLLHFWSLGVEEQFYLVWPLLLLVAARFLPTRLMGLFLVLLAAASFALAFYWTEVEPAWAFFSPFTRAWQLAAGALIAVGVLRLPRRTPRGLAGTLAVAGLLLIVASVLLLSDTTSYPGLFAVLPVAGAMLVILAGVSGPNLPSRIVLANPVSRYIGRVSYSLYLWHWPLLILLPIAIGNDDLVLRLGLAGLAFVLAAISTELLEQPFRRSGFLGARNRGSVQMGLSASVAVGVVALVMSGAISLPIPAPQPDPVTVELAGVRGDLPDHQLDRCHLQFDGVEPNDCVYGDPDSDTTAILWGDSHAGQWFPALQTYAEDRGWRLEVHTKSACTPMQVNVYERQLRRVYDECMQWRKKMNRRIRDTEPDVVFIGSQRDYDIQDNGRIIQSREIYPYWQQQLTELLKTMRERADRVVLLAETPYLNFDPVDCLSDRRSTSCDPARILSIDADYAAVEQGAATASGAELLGINDILCPTANCPSVVDGVVVFRDNHHITGTYMARLSEPIANLLEGRAPFPTPEPSPDASGDPEQPASGEGAA